MSIAEQIDASAAVESTPVGTMGDYIDGLKDDCGLIIGGIMWVVEKVTGYDLLEALLKPIAGDFNSISAMQAGWGQVAVACRGVGTNYDGLAGQLPPVWDGEAATAFTDLAGRIADSHDKQGEAAELIAEQMNHMLEVSKATAELVCSVLQFIDGIAQEILLDLASGPIGWIKGALTSPGKVRRVIQLIHQGLSAIDRLISVLKTIVNVMRALNALLDGANAVLDAFNAAAHTEAGNYTDDTAAAGF